MTPPDNAPWRPASTADIRWSADGDPSSCLFNDPYYSGGDGLQESRHVFLAGNMLPQRWERHERDQFCIVETGFGTGLNFLACWQAWREQAWELPRLHFVSIEKYPLRHEDLARALERWPTLNTLAGQLLEGYPYLIPGQHRLLFDSGRVILDLYLADVCDALDDLTGQQAALADAWFLDGFAPARNSAMWDASVFQQMAAISHPGATFATFTAAGHVRRSLTAAGFTVRKTAGFGRKRDQLQGELSQPAAPPGPPTTRYSPWHLPARPVPRPRSCLVIGGGLAGCTTAAALAARGLEVFLLEQETLASAGSGNRQGVLYTRLSTRHSAITDFALQSFSFANRYYRGRFADGSLLDGIDGQLCGSFHQSTRPQEMDELAAALSPVPDFARVLDAPAANDLLGVEQHRGGYWFPGSGWIDPAKLCRALAEDAGITVFEGCARVNLQACATGWQASNEHGTLATADCAVVACGTGCDGFAPLHWLPLQAIRGQVTQLPAALCPATPRAVFCHEGYLAPPRDGMLSVGATFDLHEADPAVRVADHRRNLDSLAGALPGWREPLAAIDVSTLRGRVGYRCASPDYLPIVGPVADYPALLLSYAGLRKNARQHIPTRGDYVPGLFVNTAHGSRGLTSTPLAAELLASQICDEPLPLSPRLQRALSPTRFTIRDLSRNRI